MKRTIFIILLLISLVVSQPGITEPQVPPDNTQQVSDEQLSPDQPTQQIPSVPEETGDQSPTEEDESVVINLNETNVIIDATSVPTITIIRHDLDERNSISIPEIFQISSTESYTPIPGTSMPLNAWIWGISSPETIDEGILYFEIIGTQPQMLESVTPLRITFDVYVDEKARELYFDIHIIGFEDKWVPTAEYLGIRFNVRDMGYYGPLFGIVFNETATAGESTIVETLFDAQEADDSQEAYLYTFYSRWDQGVLLHPMYMYIPTPEEIPRIPELHVDDSADESPERDNDEYIEESTQEPSQSQTGLSQPENPQQEMEDQLPLHPVELESNFQPEESTSIEPSQIDNLEGNIEYDQPDEQMQFESAQEQTQIESSQPQTNLPQPELQTPSQQTQPSPQPQFMSEPEEQIIQMAQSTNDPQVIQETQPVTEATQSSQYQLRTISIEPYEPIDTNTEYEQPQASEVQPVDDLYRAPSDILPPPRSRQVQSEAPNMSH